MESLISKIRSEYSTEYYKSLSSQFRKPYSKPEIFPKIIMEKSLFEFSENEKKHLMRKGNRWYVYYNFKNDKGIFVRQTPIYNQINKNTRTFEERYREAHLLREITENVLKKGYSPYNDDKKTKTNKANLNAEKALLYALQLKKNILSQTSFTDYKHRLTGFIQFLKNQSIAEIDIKGIHKKHINEYLNQILLKSSPRNRNNTLTVLKSIFATLEDNDIIENNFLTSIKKLTTKPQRNKTYSVKQEKTIYKLLEKNDKHLLLFIKFISYNFLRPIEVCRLKVENIDFEASMITLKTKQKKVKTKIIPEILMKDIQHLKELPKNYYLFTPDGSGLSEVDEINRRNYWSDRFKKIKTKIGLGSDYGLYSFRHTFITKLYRELRKEHTQIETYDKLMLITGHTTLNALKQYLRDIDAELPEDYSDLIEKANA